MDQRPEFHHAASFTVAVQGQNTMSGMQIIGWDPAAKTIRSWTFDSDGGIAEGTWTLKKDRWFIQNKGVLADGRMASMVNVIKPVDRNSFTWRGLDRADRGRRIAPEYQRGADRPGIASPASAVSRSAASIHPDTKHQYTDTG